MQSNSAVIASAGSRKTQRIVDTALTLPSKRTLVTTYTTLNQSELLSRVHDEAGRQPTNLVFQGWLPFLLEHGVRPYHRSILGSGDFLDTFNFTDKRDRFASKQKGHRHYWIDHSGNVFRDSLAEFAVEAHHRTQGAVVRRLERIFDYILIDEAQDLVGWDLEFLDLLFHSRIGVMLVGDPRQHTYATNETIKNKKYKGAGIITWLRERSELCPTQHLSVSYRCNQAICDLADSLYPDLDQTTSRNTEQTGHDGIFPVRRKEAASYYKQHRPAVLRDSRRSPTSGLPARNFLAALGAKKVTRVLAELHPELRPTIVLFSECHELFGHPDHGREAADLAVQTLRRARKTAITLAFDTQSSRADAIPPKIVELVSVNACFSVKAWRVNDGFLGDGSFQAGIRATELRPGKDVGTSVVTGASAERFEIVKWFYLDTDDDTGYDAAADLIERAMSTLAPGTAGSTAPEPRGEAEPIGRDLLADLVTVLGDQRVPAADVPALLRDLAPEWGPYRSLSGTGLRELLEREHGYRVPSTKNRYPIDPTTIRDLITRQAAGDTDGTDTGASGADRPGVRSRWNVTGPAEKHDHGPSEDGVTG